MSERYTIKGKIGQGGVGAVYRAFDTSLKRDVAIKRLLSQDGKPDEERRTAKVLVKEAGMLSKLQHPNIVTVYDVGVDDDGGYVVMELIDGENFDVTIGRGALTAEDFASVVEQTMEGLIAAQQIDMLHRDLKPSNVMVSWLPSGRFQVKLLDFGLAKLTQTPALQTINHGDAIMGSIYFMAPEQFDREPLDGRTDLYSLGCLYYFGLTGNYPFDGEGAPNVMIAHIEHDVKPLGKVRPNLPPALCDWVMRLISKEKDDRPASASKAFTEIEPVLKQIRIGDAAPAGGEQPAAEETPPVPSPNRPQLITGPVGQLPSRAAAELHTTAYQMYSTKKGAGAGPWLIWISAAIAAVAAAAILFNDGGKKKGGSKNTKQVERESSENPVEEEDLPPVEEETIGTPETPKLVLPTRRNKGGQDTPNLIYRESGWRYFDQDGVADGWEKRGFNDSDWKRGTGPFGYGEEVKTKLDFGDDELERRISYYFRKTTTISNALAQADDRIQLLAKIQYDDGFRLFINGDEVLRKGLPDGEIGPNTLAKNRGNQAAEKKFVEFQLDPTLIRNGKNVIAVQVHQTKKTSTDLRFVMVLQFREKP